MARRMHDILFSASPQDGVRLQTNRQRASGISPRLLLQGCLFGNAPVIMVRENPHAREIQTPGQPPHDFVCYLAEPLLRRVVREDYAKENRPLAAPILADLVPNADDIRSKASFNLINRGLNLRLPSDGWRHVHLDY